MPLNPCGAVCDFGRRPYRTRARFRANDPGETGIRWYIADHDAQPLPFPSAILNSDWEDNDLERDYGFDPAHLGEVRGAPRVADFGPAPQRATGAHQCGEPSWYVRGLPSAPTGLPVVYNGDGLPVCCARGRGMLWGRAPLAPRGGVAWGSFSELWPYGVYIWDEPGFEGNLMVPNAPPQFWLWDVGGPFFRLLGPAFTGSNRWEFTVSISVFFSGVWETFDWDGFGTRTFDFVSGVGVSGPTHVRRIG